MIVADVNILVAAYRADHPHHVVAHSFLTAALESDRVVVADLVWTGFLRVVTNRRVFPVPTPIDQALAFVDAVRGAAGYRPLAGLLEGIDPFLQLVERDQLSGDLIPDAYIASLALSLGCAVATFDRDFRQFDGLQIVTPQ